MYLFYATFLPCDTVLARYLLSLRVRLSVCLSVTSRCCIETRGRIELVLARRLSFTYPTLCFKEIWVSPKITVLFFWDFVPTPDLENFATEVDRVVNNTRRRRRRRSSLLTTPIRQSTSRGCLLQVDQL